MGQSGRAQAMPDDLGSRKQLIAVAMVAVVMRIEDAARRFAPDARIVFDQLAGAPQIPERVNDKAAATVDKTRIAPTQPAVRLQTGVNVFRDFLQFHSRFISSRVKSEQAPLGQQEPRIFTDATDQRGSSVISVASA